MSGLRVTPEQLAALSGAVNRVSSGIRGEHQRLKGQLMPLFGAEWVGTASTQFSALYQRFDLHARGTSDALEGIGVLLARAGHSYAEVERQIAASFR